MHDLTNQRKILQPHVIMVRPEWILILRKILQPNDTSRKYQTLSLIVTISGSIGSDGCSLRMEMNTM